MQVTTLEKILKEFLYQKNQCNFFSIVLAFCI